MSEEGRPYVSTVIQRLGGLSAIAGIVLFAGLSVLHPPTFDHRDIDGVIMEIAATPYWAPLHWGLALGSVLLGIGLLTLHSLLKREDYARYSYPAAGSMITSTTLWSAIFSVEAAGGRLLAGAYQQAAPHAGSPAIAESVRLLVHSAWSSILAVGYVAALFYGLAALLWSLDLLEVRFLPRWTAWLGVTAGALVVATQPLGWLFPEMVLWLLGPPAALWALWVAVMGWYITQLA